MKLLKIAILTATASFLYSCAPSSAINPDGTVATRPVSQSLINRGAQEFNNLKRKSRISHNRSQNAQLQRVASRLTKVINMPSAKWEFVVFANNTPNAFALPGGKVGVNSGLFQVTRNDAGLAAVIGHEIAHVTLNHAKSRQNVAIGSVIGGVLLDQLLKRNGSSSKERAAAAGVYGTAATVAGVLPFSRQQELQSDRIGAIYMAEAGYNPQESVALWKRFSAYKHKHSHGKTPEFLSTHPLDSTRIQALQNFMPTAMKVYRKHKK